MESNLHQLEIDKIRLDGGTQSRIAVNPDIIKEYARLMRDGTKLEPVEVFFDGNNYWLADGFHRVHAARRVGVQSLDANLRPGVLRDAILFSCGANATHGLRRTNADKRKAVETLLRDEEWSKWKDSEIARRCGVSLPTVAKYRAEIHASTKNLVDTQVAIQNGHAIYSNDANSEMITTASIPMRSEPHFSPLIKPSDNWNFSPVFYPRIDESAESGYIPGDVYVNAFWYYVKPGDTVVDPMAGSGMAQVVYNDRKTWMGENFYDFNLQLFDLTPQQPYIKQHNLLDGFPICDVDYIFIDIPYFDIVRGVYSDHEDDIANMAWEQYIDSLHRIAHACSTSQQPGKFCTVVSPNYVDWKEHTRRIVSMAVSDAWRSNNYEIYDMAFSTRRIQQTQTSRMAIMNNLAKERKLMLSDMSVVMTFMKKA